jgi:class 3 adenylate cyclase
MEKCWADSAQSRPTFADVQTQIGKIDSEALEERFRAKSQKRRGSRRGSQEAPSQKKKSGLPSRFTDALSLGRCTEPETFTPVTCVFTDIVGYSAMSSKMTSVETIDMLDRLYMEFDEILHKQGMHCVDIIGDAYMAVSGLMGEPHLTQVEKVATWCIEAVQVSQTVSAVPLKPDLGTVEIRAGVHTGSCTAGVVGKVSPRFSLFGDTINVSARMESLSRANCIQISQFAADVLIQGNSRYEPYLEERGSILVKGAGRMVTYWLVYPGGVDPNTLEDHSTGGK